MTDDVIGMAEAAGLLGVGRSTLWRDWRVMGLPFYRLTPAKRRWGVRRAAVIEFRSRREREQASAGG
jgi:hypothetical protein